MKDTSFEDTLERLRGSLSLPLPGPTAQYRMSPEGPVPIARLSPPVPSCREGAVLVVLYPLADEPALVLTRRPDTLPDHPGQVSLPGGRRDTSEEIIDTALRECREELGILPRSIEVLGALSPLYIHVSNYCVYPFVGALAEKPTFRMNPAEVSEIIEVPLRGLADPATIRTEQRFLRGQLRMIPFFSLDGHQVWGATAMILAEFLAVLNRATADRSEMEGLGF